MSKIFLAVNQQSTVGAAAERFDALDLHCKTRLRSFALGKKGSISSVAVVLFHFFLCLLLVQSWTSRTLASRITRLETQSISEIQTDS